MTIRRSLFTVLCLVLSFVTLKAQSRMRVQQQQQPADKAAAKAKWVDSVYRSLNQQERIGQLFMVAAYSGGKNFNQDAIETLIRNHQVGGLIFMQGGPVRQAVLTNRYQDMAQVPLLISMDAEWGLGMRLDSVLNFPRQMMLGATRDTALMYQVAMAIAYQCRRLGVHVNFSPDVDINNNADNPVINSRSFGENRYWVTMMGKAYMRGLQDNGVMACLKHFPGHGNTNVDSHKDLPVIRRSLPELQEVELYPFKKLINEGAQSVMIAHLDVPALEKEEHIPTTLSKNTITNLLKSELGFKGLVFTDALNMEAVTKYFQPGEADLRAFIAGNDILLFSQDVPAATEQINAAVENGTIAREDLEKRVKKILAAKYDYKLFKRKIISTANLTNDLNQFTQPLRTRVAESAATLAKDDNHLLAALSAKGKKVQYIGVNANTSVLESQLVRSFDDMASTWLPAGSSTTAADIAWRSLDKFDVNIIAIHNTSFYPGRDYGLEAGLQQFLKRAQLNPKTIIVLMGNAYIMQYLCNAGSALIMYEDDTASQRAAASVLQGNIIARGKLPVSVCGTLEAGKTAVTATNPALPYDLKKTDKPKLDSIVAPEALTKLDAFLNRCVSDRVFPGCRVYASMNGSVIYDKSFGYLDYRKERAVNENTIYDVASVTKVLSGTLAVMRLYEQGKLDLDKKLKDYLPWVQGTDKAGISIRNLLLHQAGLKSWIPFYKETLDPLNGSLRSDLYSNSPSPGWNTRVARGLYVKNDFKDTIWKRILDQPLEIPGKYTYSDLDFYFLQKVVEKLSGTDLDEYVQQNFYSPMGLNNISYNPLKKFAVTDIAPTENDKVFRHQQVQGYVHDQGAALLGGVAGHAGIFATAQDVGAIFELLLKNGVYNGKRYFTAATVNKFTAYNSSSSRRGLGFDKPANERNDAGPAGERSSGYAFGHQGFTGTCAWADPANGIVFVFLSNRVYPDADNNGINKLSVRTLAQDYIYEALGVPENKARPEVYQSQLKAIK